MDSSLENFCCFQGNSNINVIIIVSIVILYQLCSPSTYCVINAQFKPRLLGGDLVAGRPHVQTGVAPAFRTVRAVCAPTPTVPKGQIPLKELLGYAWLAKKFVSFFSVK